MEWWDSFVEWFMGLGTHYGVNPLIFGSLYVGAIPFFTFSLAWLIRNIRLGRPILLPLFLTSLFFIASYIYLIVVGRNIPFWVYLVIAGMILIGIISTWNKIKRRVGNRQKD